MRYVLIMSSCDFEARRSLSKVLDCEELFRPHVVYLFKRVGLLLYQIIESAAQDDVLWHAEELKFLTPNLCHGRRLETRSRC